MIYKHRHPSISILITTYKRPASVSRLLSLLDKQAHIDFDRMEAIVVNDGSPEGYPGGYAGFRYNVKYKLLERRPDDKPAYCAAQNEAFSMSENDLIIFFDDGNVIDDHTLFTHCLYHMLASQRIAVFAHEVPPSSNPNIQNELVVQTPGDDLVDLWVSTGSNSVMAKDWEDIGGFDESFDGSMGFDDRDFAIRLYNDGVALILGDGVTKMSEDSETGGSWTAKLSVQDDHVNGEKFFQKWPEYKDATWGKS